jgi:hypothetical protein
MHIFLIIQQVLSVGSEELTEGGIVLTSWPEDRLPRFLGILGLFVREEFLERTAHTGP